MVFLVVVVDDDGDGICRDVQRMCYVPAKSFTGDGDDTVCDREMKKSSILQHHQMKKKKKTKRENEESEI